jgi:hypothetical protein
MQTETQASLDESRAYLRDCIEVSHLQLKRKLEAMRRGEEIDWRETRDIMREGRTAARQLTQIAALEVRDRQQDTRPAGPRRAPRSKSVQLKVQPTAEMALRFVNGVMDWQKASAESGKMADMPADLRKLIVEVGLDPDSADSFDTLFEVFESQAAHRSAA